MTVKPVYSGHLYIFVYLYLAYLSVTPYTAPSNEFIYVADIVYPLCESEIENIYLIELFVTDMGTPPRNDTSQVEVTVLDVNIYTPEFEKASYVSLVDKESPQGMVP